MGSNRIVSLIITLQLSAAIGSLTGQQFAPSTLSAVPQGQAKIQLTWPVAAGAKGYRVQRGPVGGNLADISGLLTGTSYLDEAAPTGVDVSYRIKTSYPVPAGQPPIIKHSPVVVVKWSDRAPANTASNNPPPSSSNNQPPPASNNQPPTSPATVPSSPVAVSSNRAVNSGQFAGAGSKQFQAAPGAAAPAPVTSGRYRVVANGFSVVRRAHSHYDDVYGGFVMLHFNRQNGELLDRDSRHTMVLGNFNGRVMGETDGGTFPRLRAGSFQPYGGLQDGDNYPDAGHARFRGPNGTPPNRQTFPFEVWTGDLANASDAVVILPTLWSRDGKTQPYEDWQSRELGSASQIWYDQAVQQALRQTTLGVIAPPGAITPNSNQNFEQLAKLVGAAIVGGMGQPWAFALVFDPAARDFPIGFDPQAKVLPRRAIVLTREMIEQALNTQPVAPGPEAMPAGAPWLQAYFQVPAPGIIPILFMDGGAPEKATAYVIYLQVERL